MVTILPGYGRLYKWVKGKEKQVDVSVEIAGVLMMIEYCVVLGFAVPVVLPLVVIAFFSHLAVFHEVVRRGMKLSHNSRPTTLYPRLSLLLGLGLVMWHFISNGLHGRILVAIGMPAMYVAAHVLDMLVPLHRTPWHGIVNTTKSWWIEPRANDGEDKRASFFKESCGINKLVMEVALPTMGTASGHAYPLADLMSGKEAVVRL